jgi:hypothetical protein
MRNMRGGCRDLIRVVSDTSDCADCNSGWGIVRLEFWDTCDYNFAS